jgi:predicted dehydrogenase
VKGARGSGSAGAGKPVNVGVIGLRGYGEHHLQECRAHPNGRVLAVCDSDRALAEAAAREHSAAAGAFTDYREMLKLGELDAVAIAAPHFLHRPMMLAALAAGKHVLCEKPFTTRGRHAAEAVRLARRKGLVLSCNYSRRLTPPVGALRKLVADGALGEVYHARARWLARWTGFLFAPETTWRTSRARAGGGILIGRGCHLVDAVLYMLGFPRARKVFAICHRLAGLEVEDLACLTLTLETGASIEIEASYVLHGPEVQGGDDIQYALYGTRAGAAFRSAPGGGSLSAGSCDLATGRWQPLEAAGLPEASPGPAARTVMADFLDSIAGGREPLVTGEQAAAVIRIIEAGYRSAATRRAVDLPPMRGTGKGTRA